MDVLILSAVAIFNSALGVFLIAKNPRSKTNLSFAIITFGITFWAIAWAAALGTTDLNAKLFWTRMMLAGPAFIPTAFLYFSLVFPKEAEITKKISIPFFFALPSLALAEFTPTNFYIKDVRFAPWGVDFTPGPGYPIYMAVFTAYMGMAFFVLARKYFKY